VNDRSSRCRRPTLAVSHSCRFDSSLVFAVVQNDLGIINNGLAYALYDHEPTDPSDATTKNELTFKDGDQLRIVRRGDEHESEWWWAKHENMSKEGYVPRNYLGVTIEHDVNPRDTTCRLVSCLVVSASTSRIDGFHQLLMNADGRVAFAFVHSGFPSFVLVLFCSSCTNLNDLLFICSFLSLCLLLLPFYQIYHCQSKSK
jgi:hypothetical protein